MKLLEIPRYRVLNRNSRTKTFQWRMFEIILCTKLSSIWGEERLIFLFEQLQ